MNKLILASVSTLALTSAAMAADIGGEIAIDFTQNLDDKIVASTGIELNLIGTAGNVSVDFAVVEDAITIDGYSVGTTVSGMTLSFGDQGDAFGDFSGGLETVGGTTLTNPTGGDESLMVTASGVAVYFGLTDVTSDIADVSNVQLTYSTALVDGSVAVGIDYNTASEDSVLGVAAETSYADMGVGVIATYSTSDELLAYELSASNMSIKAFVDGDNTDALQNMGVGYTGTFNDVGYYVEAAYNIESEEVAPAFGLTFTF